MLTIALYLFTQSCSIRSTLIGYLAYDEATEEEREQLFGSKKGMLEQGPIIAGRRRTKKPNFFDPEAPEEHVHASVNSQSGLSDEEAREEETQSEAIVTAEKDPQSSVRANRGDDEMRAETKVQSKRGASESNRGKNQARAERRRKAKKRAKTKPVTKRIEELSLWQCSSCLAQNVSINTLCNQCGRMKKTRTSQGSPIPRSPAEPCSAVEALHAQQTPSVNPEPDTFNTSSQSPQCNACEGWDPAQHTCGKQNSPSYSSHSIPQSPRYLLLSPSLSQTQLFEPSGSPPGFSPWDDSEQWFDLCSCLPLFVPSFIPFLS